MILSARFVGNGGTSFCSFASSAITSGVKTSTRVESSWPILMKVGPSLISVSRSSAARLARAFTSASPSRPRPRSRATLSAWPMQLVQMYTERFTTHQLRRSGFFGARGACTVTAPAIATTARERGGALLGEEEDSGEDSASGCAAARWTRPAGGALTAMGNATGSSASSSSKAILALRP